MRPGSPRQTKKGQRGGRPDRGTGGGRASELGGCPRHFSPGRKRGAVVPSQHAKRLEITARCGREFRKILSLVKN